jgi:hypothetical protein
MPSAQEHSMHRMLVLVPLLLACASSGSAPSAPPPPPQNIEAAAGTRLRVEGQAVVVGGTIAAPIDSAWKAMIKVYQELGIEPSILISDSHTIGNQSLKLRRVLGGVPLSRYVNCGAGTGVGPNADYYKIEMSVVTSLSANTEAATDVRTRVDATATPLSVASNQVVCTSTGMLEQRIVKMLQERA